MFLFGHTIEVIQIYKISVIVFNATFNNISVISCRSVLEESCYCGFKLFINTSLYTQS